MQYERLPFATGTLKGQKEVTPKKFRTMQSKDKSILRALNGEILPRPPVWVMRQAGRYLPEYRATRAQAGDFLSLCYNSDLATEVTLQPIRRYGFDAAIVFADILLVPQALGARLSFVTGEGPRLSPIKTAADMNGLGGADDIHDTLAPIYQTLRNLRGALPLETALIGFAGAPWTVATYMIAGAGEPGQKTSLRFMREHRVIFDALMERLTDATIAYLLAQIKAGAEVIKLFDSWAGALQGDEFARYIIAPTVRIVRSLRSASDVPIIGFPRGVSGADYRLYFEQTGVQGLAIGHELKPDWAATHLQPLGCVQGNLDPAVLVAGGEALASQTRAIVAAFSQGAHIFNLGHGITPDANPRHIDVMLRAVRG